MAGLRALTEQQREIVGKHAARHGRVLALDMPIADDSGGIGAPLIRLSTLARLEHRGTITRREAEAGEVFHRLFQLAHLDALRAADMGRVPGGAGPGDLSPAGERCRNQVALAMKALGGNTSIAASIIWHCIGLEWPIARWIVNTPARLSRDQACGTLVGALAVLAAHFAGGRRPK